MRKIINFRAFLFTAVGLIIGIYSFYEFLFGDFWFGLVAIIIVALLGALAALLKSKAWLIALFTAVFILIGFGISHLSFQIVTKNEAKGREITVTGRVTDIYRNGAEESNRFYIENCVLKDGDKIIGKIEMYLYEDELSVDTGDIITVSGKLYSKYPIKHGTNASVLRLNTLYNLEDAQLLKQEDGKPNVTETVRKYVYDTVIKYMPQNGAVMYALLFGDRNPLSDDVVEIFQKAGIFHLLAVSGLHIGFVVAIVSFLLKRFKMHPLIEGAIVIVPLILYAYICSFTPSVLRAVIMVLCTYLARAVFGKYDLLSSLSFAVVCILLIKPFYLLDLGFQLSALSVYGIATVYPTLNRWLSKRKVHKVFKYLINSIIVSFSCSVATLFTALANFGYFPTMGMLLNVAIIPLVSVAFVLGFVGMLPIFFHYVLLLADKILQLVAICANFIAELPFSVVEFKAMSLCVIVVVIWLFILGGYVNLKKTGKIVANTLCAVILAVCIGLSFALVKPSDKFYVAYGYEDTMCVVMSNSGEIAVVGNFCDEYATYLTIQYLGKYKISNCVLYFVSYDKADVELIDDILKVVDINKAYKLDFSFNGDVDERLSNNNVAVVQQMKNDVTGNHVKVSSVFDADLIGVVMEAGGINISLVCGERDKIDRYPSLVDYSDLYVLRWASQEYSRQNLTTLSFRQSEYDYNYGANKYGNFTIVQKDGKIAILFR